MEPRMEGKNTTPPCIATPLVSGNGLRKQLILALPVALAYLDDF
jgi:hypothetical protein